MCNRTVTVVAHTHFSLSYLHFRCSIPFWCFDLKSQNNEERRKEIPKRQKDLDSGSLSCF